MAVLGYSELLKEIYGINPHSLENEISKFLQSKPSNNKIRILKELKKSQRATISELLRHSLLPNTGGSFKSIRKFFEELVRLNILKKDTTVKRTYYYFNPESDLSKWL